MAPNEIKALLRQEMIQALKNLPAQDRQVYQDQLFQQVLDLVEEEEYTKLAIYYGFQPEIETPQLIDQLQDRRVQVYLPRILPQRQMSFHLFKKASDLETVQGKIRQPKATAAEIDPGDLDLVVVPGLAFKLSGQRVGFGGGYYDRFLAKYKPRTLSLAFPSQVHQPDAWEDEAHDIPIDQVLRVEAVHHE